MTCRTCSLMPQATASSRSASRISWSRARWRVVSRSPAQVRSLRYRHGVSAFRPRRWWASQERRRRTVVTLVGEPDDVPVVGADLRSGQAFSDCGTELGGQVDRDEADPAAPPPGPCLQPLLDGGAAAAVDDVEDGAGREVGEHDAPRLDPGDLSGVLVAQVPDGAEAVLIDPQGLDVAVVDVSGQVGHVDHGVEQPHHRRPREGVLQRHPRDRPRLAKGGVDDVLGQPRGEPGTGRELVGLLGERRSWTVGFETRVAAFADEDPDRPAAAGQVLDLLDRAGVDPRGDHPTRRAAGPGLGLDRLDQHRPDSLTRVVLAGWGDRDDAIPGKVEQRRRRVTPSIARLGWPRWAGFRVGERTLGQGSRSSRWMLRQHPCSQGREPPHRRRTTLKVEDPFIRARSRGSA